LNILRTDDVRNRQHAAVRWYLWLIQRRMSFNPLSDRLIRNRAATINR
jgi:hypothetical protein